MGVIIRPVISEKANGEAEARQRYTFLVQTKANKIEIKKEIEKLYGVEVKQVSTQVCAPNIKVKHTKKGLQVGKTNKLKKAVIGLAEGQTLDIYSI